MKSFWWISLPKKLGWISNWLTQILTDGYYLVTFNPSFKKWLSPAVFIAGILTGLSHPYKLVLVEIPVIFYLFLAVGMLSSHLGFLLLLGFAIGDMTVLPEYLNRRPSAIPAYKGLYWVIFAKIHAGIIFGIGIVLVPLLSKQLAVSLGRSLIERNMSFLKRDIGQLVFLGALACVNVLCAVALVYFWSNAMTLMIRTIHLHAAVEKRPAEVVVFFQHQWWVLMLIAGLAMTVRQVAQWVSLFNTSMASTSEKYEEAVAEFYTKAGLLDKLPKWLGAIGQASFLTFLVEGAFFDRDERMLSYQNLGIFWAIALLLFVLNGYITQIRICPVWLRKFWRFPMGVRVILAMILSGGAVYGFLSIWHDREADFWVILIPILLNLFLFSVLLPHHQSKSDGNDTL